MLGAVAYMTADEKRALRENVERLTGMRFMRQWSKGIFLLTT